MIERTVVCFEFVLKIIRSAVDIERQLEDASNVFPGIKRERFICNKIGSFVFEEREVKRLKYLSMNSPRVMIASIDI